MKTKLFTAFALIVFVIGLAGMRAKSAQQLPPTSEETERLLQAALPARGFTATQIETYISAKGEKTVRHIRKCEVKADGSWTQVWEGVGNDRKTYLSGDPNTGKNTIATDKGESMALPGQPGTSSGLYRSREFLQQRAGGRKETIAGLDGYLLRSDDGKGQWLETAHAPETGVFPLRIIQHLRDGSEVRIETTSVTFVE